MPGSKHWWHDWRLHLLEIFIAALTVCSGLTTFIGARKLVNGSALVALLFTIGIQGSLFVVAHRATAAEGKSRRRRKVALYSTWLLLSLFSVYSSALGMFELQKDSLRNDHERAAFASEWRASVEDINTFRAQSLAAVRARQRETSLHLTFEKNRELAYRRQRREYSPREKQTLKARLDALTGAERKLIEMNAPGAAPPDDIEQARAALDAAFASAADAYSSLPDDCRAECRAPRHSFGAPLPDDLQKAFWMEIQMRSAPALFMLSVAFLLDFLPMGIRYACRPRRSLAEAIRAWRISARATWSALRQPLSQKTESVRLVIEGYRELDIEVEFAANGAGPFLEDLQRHFDVAERAVSDMAGEQMQIIAARSSSGERLSPDSSLMSQLDRDRAIHLQLEPLEVEANL